MVILTVTTGNDIRNAHPDLEKDDTRPYFLIDSGGNLYLKPFKFPKGLSIGGISIGRFIAEKVFFPHSYIYLAQTLGPLRWQFKTKKTLAENALPVHLDSYVYIDPYPHVWEEAWRATLGVIKKVKRELESKRIEFLVVVFTDSDGQIDGTLQSFLENSTKGKNIKWDSEKPIKILGKYCRENKINFLPLLYEFKKEFSRTHEKFHFIYDGHPNKRGHELAADIIYKKITAEGLIK